MRFVIIIHLLEFARLLPMWKIVGQSRGYHEIPNEKGKHFIQFEYVQELLL